MTLPVPLAGKSRGERSRRPADPARDADTIHLHAGPIDLVVRAWGPPPAVRAAFAAARAAFAPILPGLCAELSLLRSPLPAFLPVHPVARAMHRACLPFAPGFITPMAAVAGAVADHVLAAMVAAAPALRRALVNNRGDIALFLQPGERLDCALVTDLAAPALDALLRLRAEQPSRGLATSGRACRGQGGRSFSFGIADSVTVLAATAAAADAAATVVANAVDLPGHPAVTRVAATAVDPDSDLGSRPVTWSLGPVTTADAAQALRAGLAEAERLCRAGLIHGAVLALRGQLLATAEAHRRLDTAA